jgi:lipid-binding SYLF domain-containing protein
MHFTRPLAALLMLGLLVIAGCSTMPETTADRDQLKDRAEYTVEKFKKADPSLKDNFFASAKGWAVFPSVGKGGMGVGGAYGKGVLYEGGDVVGYCSLKQASIGFQLGGQSYSELIFFRTDDALANFKQGDMNLSAQVSATAAEAGAGAKGDWDGGVAVFVHGSKGLMYEASVAGQKFDFIPADTVE